MARIDYSGKRFGRLVVVGEAGRSPHGGNMIWRCHCDCGNSTDVLSTSLRLGDTQSCGCLQSDLASARMTKHGHAQHGTSRTYNSWASMVQRCTNPNYYQYKNYAGRGITVCAEWADNFQQFLSDMGERPPGTSLDRFPNNDGNYEPGNCRWATPKEQSNNRRPYRPRRKPTIEIREIRA